MIYGSNNLLGYAVYAFLLLFKVIRAESGAICKDQQGQSYENGFHYVPGPEPCTLCVCDNGNPKWCKGFICRNAEEDCISSRRGDICCQHICLDDTLSSVSNDKNDGIGGNTTEATTNYDIGLRSVASFVTAVLSLSLLFFLIHRLRQRKIRVCVAGRQNRQLAEDQRNLGRMGYLERDGLSHGVPMDDIPCGANYPLWKPPNNYFPRGEAPPPYEEAVAAARAEQALLSMNPQTLPQLNFPSNYLPSANSRATISLVGSVQAGINGNQSTLICTNGTSDQSGFVSTPNRPISNPNIYSSYRQTNQNETLSPGVSVGTSTTNFTMGTSTYENLPPPIGILSFPNQRTDVTVQPVSNFQSAIPKSSYQTHTTLPRQTGAFTISATLPNSSMATHRTIPRTLTTRSGVKIQDITSDCTQKDFPRPTVAVDISTPSLPHSVQQSVASKLESTRENTDQATFCEDVQIPPCPTSSSESQQIDVQPLDHKTDKSHEFKPSLNVANAINEEGSFESVTCTCSMQALPTLHDDTDDYRSECENCKSATGSRYYLDNEDELVTSPHETMTLHRRPDEASLSATPQYYRTSLTLPISTRQRTRSNGPRENWFKPNTMPQSSTESSDEN